jgi:hypothetical protein
MTGFSDSSNDCRREANVRKTGLVSFSLFHASWREESLCKTTAAPALENFIEIQWSDALDMNEDANSGLAAVRPNPGPSPPSFPAFARRRCRRSRRASFSSNPACFALPLSSNASTNVSLRALYAAVLRIGSVVDAMVEDTAADALEI